MLIRRWIVTFAIVGTVLGGIALYKNHLVSAKNQQGGGGYEPEMSVVAHEVSFSSYQPVASVNGEVQAFRKVSLQNELAGNIVELNFSSGDIVEKGQVLLRLDHRQESAALAGARANLSMAKLRVSRLTKLHKTQEVSEDQLDEAKTQLALSKAEVDALEVTIAKKVIKAPFGAQVGIHDFELGQYLDANTQITTLISLDNTMYVDFLLPQSYPVLSKGDSINIALIGSSQTTQAKVVAIAPEMSQVRAVKYRAAYQRDTLTAKPNALVKVTVPVNQAKQIARIPELSLVRNQMGNFVYRIETQEDGVKRAKMVAVTVLESEGEQLLVSQGVAVGDVIAGKGAFKLWPDVKVKLVTDSLQEQG